MSRTARQVTAEELERFRDDDYRYELVQGRVTRMSPVGFQHGKVVMRVGFLLSRHLENRRVGVALTEVGFTLARNPDTVRAPDIAFVRQDRIPSSDTRGFLNGPPDLAIEVLSPDDRLSEVNEKVDEYLTRGVGLVVVVDPEEKTVTTFRPGTPSVILRADDDTLDLNDVIRGFRCSLREVFE